MPADKASIINDAYSQLRISGILVEPRAEDSTLALHRLENMMAEFFARNIGVGYTFENEPTALCLHNVDRQFWFPIASCLALRLCSDFGKEPTIALLAWGRSGFSFMSSATALVSQVAYPERAPLGSGNSNSMIKTRFFTPISTAPISSKTVNMYIDDIEDFTENFNSFLLSGETLSSVVITADSGLTIVSQSVSSPILSYRIKAVGSSSEVSNESLRIKMVATSSTGRIETRFIYFSLTSGDLS